MEPEKFTVRSSRGDCEIQCYAWIPEGNVRCTLQISHGMLDHATRYSKFAEFLNKNHVAVFAHDHLGHGETESGTRGHFAESDGDMYLVDDVFQITRKINSRYPDVKHMILGHSMGSFIVRRYLTKYGEYVDGAIICGTGRKKKSTLKHGIRIAKLLCMIKGPESRSNMLHKAAVGYDKKFPGDKPNRWLTRDESVVDAYNEDPLVQFQFTNRAYVDLFKLLYDLETYVDFRNIPRNLPIIFISGTDDPVGDYGKGVEECHSVLLAMGLHPGIRLYHGARHELLNETNWREVYEDIMIWINGVIDNEGGLGCRY